MTPNEIRCMSPSYSGDRPDYDALNCAMLQEIAAQLADHNSRMDRLEFLFENIISINQECRGLQVRVNNG